VYHPTINIVCSWSSLNYIVPIITLQSIASGFTVYEIVTAVSIYVVYGEGFGNKKGPTSSEKRSI
jgi:hypothetical protein